jgi:hypothetical protein
MRLVSPGKNADKDNDDKCNRELKLLGKRTAKRHLFGEERRLLPKHDRHVKERRPVGAERGRHQQVRVVGVRVGDDEQADAEARAHVLQPRAQFGSRVDEARGVGADGGKVAGGWVGGSAFKYDILEC